LSKVQDVADGQGTPAPRPARGRIARLLLHGVRGNAGYPRSQDTGAWNYQAVEALTRWRAARRDTDVSPLAYRVEDCVMDGRIHVFWPEAEMPIYEYQAREKTKSCSHCGEPFEVFQNISDCPLAECPRCGAPLRKLISTPCVGKSKSGFDDRAKTAGFHKLQRTGKGEYEKKY